MSHLIVFESPFGVVALTRDELQHALAAAAELLPSSAPASVSAAPNSERWLTAEECEAATGVPKSWFAEGARRGTIPCKRAGHYVRFVLSELDDALAQRPNDARTRNERVTRSQLVDPARVPPRKTTAVASNVAAPRKNGGIGDAGVTR